MSSASEYCQRLMRELNAMRCKQMLCDMTLVVNSRRYSVHRCVLAARIPKLYDIVSDPIVSELPLGVSDERVAEIFLEFLYSGELRLDFTCVRDLLRLGFEFALDDLVSLVTRELTGLLSLHNWIEVLLIAHEFELALTKKQVFEFVTRHVRSIREGKTFENVDCGTFQSILCGLDHDDGDITTETSFAVFQQFVQSLHCEQTGEFTKREFFSENPAVCHTAIQDLITDKKGTKELKSNFLNKNAADNSNRRPRKEIGKLTEQNHIRPIRKRNSSKALNETCIKIYPKRGRIKCANSDLPTFSAEEFCGRKCPTEKELEHKMGATVECVHLHSHYEQCTLSSQVHSICNDAEFQPSALHDSVGTDLSGQLSNFSEKPCSVHQHDAKTENELHACPLCPKTFARRGAQQKHIRGHGRDNALLCEVCGFCSKHTTSMSCHKQGHFGRRLKCTYAGCNYSATRSYRMRDHINSHLGRKDYTCAICGKSFATQSHLQRHEKIHTDAKKFACTTCSYHTGRSDKFREHIAKHHGHKAKRNGGGKTEL